MNVTDSLQRSDWGDIDNNRELFDIYSTFASKTPTEIQEIFSKNIVMRCLDFHDMPTKPFLFLFHELCMFVISGKFEDYEFPIVFGAYYGVFEVFCEKELQMNEGLREDLLVVTRYANERLCHQTDYDAESVQEILDAIKNIARKAGSSEPSRT